MGMKLSQQLSKKEYLVSHLSRKEDLTATYPAYYWNLDNGEIDPRALEVDHVIHLAGAGVADGRWTKHRKKQIYDSRILSTRLLAEKIKGTNVKSVVCASAIGIYGGDTGSNWVDEQSTYGDDFLAKVVTDWELETTGFTVPVSQIRIGIVLSNEGGALPRIALPVKWGLGAALGRGQQYMSWIHVQDLVDMFEFALVNRLSGPYNAAAPQPVTNRDFTKSIGKAINRPVWLPAIPGFLLKMVLGEMSQVVLGGNRVSSEKIVKQGFDFTYKELQPALKNILN